MYSCEFSTDFVDEEKFRRNLSSYAYNGSFVLCDYAPEDMTISKNNSGEGDIFHITFRSRFPSGIMAFMAAVRHAQKDGALSARLKTGVLEDYF